MNQLIAQKFFNDKEVIGAKKQILAALQEYQSQLTGIRPPQSELKQSYDDMIKAFQEARGGKLLFPYLSSGIGNGALVELADGSVKYDFIIGIGVHYFGHSHLGLIEKVMDAALEDTVMQGNLQQGTESAAFSNTLLKAATSKGAKLKHCFLTSTGVMAGENALKIAFQKKNPAERVLCFKDCFMGRTLIMAQTTDNPAYRVGLPKFIHVDYVPFFDAQKPKESTEEAVSVLKQHLKDYPNQYAAMCFELVLGEGGFYPGSREFFTSLMDVLKDNDIPILVDEVQSFARTPEIFAFQYYGLDSYVDVVWIGKASQACATFFTEAIKPKPGLISQTYTSSSTAIAAGHYIVQTLLNENYYGQNGKIAKLHDHCKSKLEDIAKRHPDLVKGPYGIGAMIAFTPFDGSADKAKIFIKQLYESGVIAFYCGKEPTRIRFLIPAGAIDTNDIDTVTTIVEETLIKVSKTFS